MRATTVVGAAGGAGRTTVDETDASPALKMTSYGRPGSSGNAGVKRRTSSATRYVPSIAGASGATATRRTRVHSSAV
jgi:hypothetical protein